MSTKSPESPQVAAARIEVERSRGRLMDKAHELQERLSPKTIANNAWQGAKEKGAGLAEDAVDVARTRPLATGGVVAALTMFLAREPLMDFAGSLFGSEKRKARKTRKAQAKQKQTEKSE